MPSIPSQTLTELSQSIFTAAGAPPETAQIVAESLIKSNLLGHDSHGVQLIPGYVKNIQQGRIDPQAQPIVQQQTAATAVVNGAWGFGQIVARHGTILAAKLAQEAGLACVALSQSNHIGRLGEYAQMLAEQGLVGMIMTGISGHEGAVAPFGGRDRIFGTNPIAWAVPVGEARPPLVLDYATSAVAFGKVTLALSKGTSIPEGILLDKHGHPSTNPADLLDDGVLLPFGGHKGYGLILMIELLTQGLSGFADAPPGEDRIGNPTLITAWSVEAFLPQDQFQTYVETLLQRIKNSRPATGFDEILLPGEPEAKTRRHRAEAGIPIPEATWQKLTDLAQDLGVSL